jgi:hypothetical protein
MTLADFLKCIEPLAVVVNMETNFSSHFTNYLIVYQDATVFNNRKIS